MRHKIYINYEIEIDGSQLSSFFGSLYSTFYFLKRSQYKVVQIFQLPHPQLKAGFYSIESLFFKFLITSNNFSLFTKVSKAFPSFLLCLCQDMIWPMAVLISSFWLWSLVSILANYRFFFFYLSKLIFKCCISFSYSIGLLVLKLFIDFQSYLLLRLKVLGAFFSDLLLILISLF